MSSLPTVLFFTYSEYGQANECLATSYELALAGVNVHIASFPALKTRIDQLQELIDRHRSSSKPVGSVTFQECKGVLPFPEAMARGGVTRADQPHPPGLGVLVNYSRIHILAVPWSADEYLAAIESFKEMITAIKPNLVVVDSVFLAALDACELLNEAFMVIYANGFKEAMMKKQPYLAAFWKYPLAGTAFSFPLKWWQIPLNIYIYIRLIIQVLTSSHLKCINAVRQSLGLGRLFGPRRGLHIWSTFPELDFPFAVIPEEFIFCGPIILPFVPLEESDPGLMEWLDKGPTVLINFGSNRVSNVELASEIAGALRILLDYHAQQGSSKTQVLWKVKANGDVQGVIDKVIGKEIKEGVVRVVAWLDADPVSIMEHPNLVCTVHHGGANSFGEGVWFGTPQIVLPVWYDTYDYANRAEYLNIGIFGSKSCAPGVRAEEFGRALVRVTGNSEEARKLRASAKRLMDVCRAKGNGRVLASAAILKVLEAK